LGEPFPNSTETRLQQVNARVTGIIRDCFDPQDTVLLLINDWQGPDPMFGNSTPGYLFDLLGKEHLDRAAERLVRLPDEGDDTAPAHCRQVIL
jgi:hypothetical protein